MANRAKVDCCRQLQLVSQLNYTHFKLNHFICPIKFVYNCFTLFLLLLLLSFEGADNKRLELAIKKMAVHFILGKWNMFGVINYRKQGACIIKYSINV